MKKKLTALCIAAVCATAPAAEVCAENIIDGTELGMHKIGVVVYNIADEQVVAFRDYLENYIELCFPDVDFIYSSSVNTAEQEMEFIQNVCDAGAEGILSFNSYDLEAEVKLCEQNGVYYMRASSGVSDEDYAKVADNEFYLGSIGPDTDMEYEAGYDMGKHFAESHEKGNYFISSGGAGFGVLSHVLRTQGMIDGLKDGYGLDLSEKSEDLAASPMSVSAETDGMKITVAPGFLDSENFLPAVVEAYEQDTYPVVLSAYPLADFADVAKASVVGLVDCYSVTNLQLFNTGKLNYLSGKFSSCIGPSFAAMYNAVTGNASDFRDQGKAFRITQGFWVSDSLEDYNTKYALSSSIAINAYNYEDLQNVCKIYNPDASLEDLKTLAEAYTFEDAAARRY